MHEFNDSQLISNVLDTFESASPAERRSGMLWYSTARTSIKINALRFGLDVKELELATAVLSPNLTWEINIRAACRFLHGATSAGYQQNKNKAADILSTDGWYDDLEKLGDEWFQTAPKTWAFYLLISGRDTTAVCIDGHAYSIAVGKKLRMKDIPSLVSCNRYERLVHTYTEAADMKGVLPHQMQAVTWTAHRGSGRSDPNQTSLFL